MILKPLAAILLAALALPAASAAGVNFDVGASGRCYDDTPVHPALAGGESQLYVNNNDLSGVTNFDPVGAALALAAFVLPPGAAGSGAGCSSTSAVDYLEVHAFVDATGDGTYEHQVYACYAGNADPTVILATQCYPVAP